MRSTQCQQIVQYINDFGSITRMEAMYELGVANFGARESDLKKNGITLESKWEHGTNRYGKPIKWKRYWLSE